jgi:glycosyltransferase involved in cell wall biosynthesis
MKKISIVTAVYNNRETVRQAIESVISQDYPLIEYIIVDGASTDGTIEIIRSYEDRISKFISEPDCGIYDAMNKGLNLATGEIIGILNSDDFYFNNEVISDIVREFDKTEVDIVYGDLLYVSPDNLNKVVRYYSSAKCTPDSFAWGWMPAHPTCFIKKSAYEKHGDFKTNYKIAADYEIMTRFMAKYRLSYSYLPKVMVKMRTGGVSTRNLQSNWILNREIVRACKENGISTNILKVLSKYFTKIFQLFMLSPL